MNTQLININTGEFTLSNDFIISDKTRVQDLISFFKDYKLMVSNMQNGSSNYSIENFKIANLYFNITIYFKQLVKVNRLTTISFILSDTPYSISTKSWDNFNKEKAEKDGQFMKDWLNKQLANSDSIFKWGSANIFYDPHNFIYLCNISYADAITEQLIN